MNAIVYIYYCYCSIDHNKIESLEHIYCDVFVLDENSFSATDYKLADLLDDNVETYNFVNPNNSYNLVSLNHIEEINFDFAFLVPSTSDEIKDQSKNIACDHQKIEFLNDKISNNIDIKIGLEK